jgi:glycosyltransferase involved in cell wall biosynthesis
VTTSSVLISTYNRPLALNRVLEGLSQQAQPATEIVIADDGSTSETRLVIERWIALGLPIRHCWHEDKGYRKTTIMNRAVLTSSCEVLIFLDGDCIPLSSFVRDHLQMHECSCIHAGPRILASPSLTGKIEESGFDQRSVWFWLKARVTGGVNRLGPLLRLPDGEWRHRNPHRWELVRGCNFSVRRESVLAVDGFEGSLLGWGPDDSDIAVRLINSGLRVKNLRFAAPVLHLWHREEDRGGLQKNLSFLHLAQTERRTKPQIGLSALTP